MSVAIYLTTVGVIFGTILAVFAMRYIAQTRQAASDIARENAYRALADKSASVLAAVQAELAEVKSRLASVETILKTVE